MEGLDSMKRGKRIKTKFLAGFLTVFIITLLILSGPASAITVNLTQLVTGDESLTGAYSYMAIVDIHTNDIVPLDFVYIKLTDTNTSTVSNCYYEISTKLWNSTYSNESTPGICSDINMSSIVNHAAYSTSYGYNYGYGYGNSSGRSEGLNNVSWDYGYGYGSVNGYGYNAFTENLSTSGEVEIYFTINSSNSEFNISDKYNIKAGISGLKNGHIEYNYYNKNTITFFGKGKDITPPTFTTIPVNSSLFYGNQSLSVTFVGTDAVGFSMIFINDSRFTMTNSTGVLTNATPMAVGTYTINVTINDTANNKNWTFYKVQINKSTSVVNTYINNSQVNLTIQSGTSIWLNSTLTIGNVLGGGVLSLLVDGRMLNSSADNNLTYQSYYNRFDTLGTHNVSTDYTGNQNYSAFSETFYNVTVIDTTGPTYSHNSTNGNTEVGQPTLFSINVSDNYGLQTHGGYIFSTNNTFGNATWVNDSFVPFSTNPSWAYATETLNTTNGTTIGYKWYFNDTLNNVNQTANYTLKTTADITPPTYSGNAIVPDNTYAGREAGFTIDVTDIIALEPNGQYIFSTNDSGVWVNDSVVNFKTTSEIARSVKTLNSTIGKVVGYRWYFSDNSSNTNSTPIYSLTITHSPGSGSGSTTGGSSSTSTPTTYTTDEQFSGGAGNEYNLKVSDKISFPVGSVSHSLTLNQFNSTAARVTIASTPISATLQKGVLYEVDTNGDSVKDIRVRYDGLSGTKAMIFIQEIAPVVSPPAQETPTTPTENTNDNTNTNTPAPTGDTTSDSSPWKIVIIIVAILVIALIVVLLIRKEQKTKRHYMYGY